MCKLLKRELVENKLKKDINIIKRIIFICYIFSVNYNLNSMYCLYFNVL